MSDGASVELADELERDYPAVDVTSVVFSRDFAGIGCCVIPQDRVLAVIAALRASPPAAPAGGERETALRDQVFKTIEVLQSPDVTMDSEFRSFTAKQLQKALDYAAPAQSIEDEREREAAIDRIISIRNGMTTDLEARAIVRRELAALGATARSNGDEGRVYAVGGDGTFDESDERPNEFTTILDADFESLLTDRRELATVRDQLAKARAALETAKRQLITLGGDREWLNIGDADQIHAAVLDEIDTVLEGSRS